MDPTILSFQNHLLRKSDVDLLEDGNWINDNIIGFMFEYFHCNLFKEKSQMVSFVDPDVVQLVKMCAEEDAKQIILPLQLDAKQLIFLPLNDNEHELTEGGTHWSLMVFDSSSPVVEHYDSYSGFHDDTAAKIFRIFSKIIFKTRDNIDLCQMPVSQQVNGYDCGVYVIKIAEEVCRAKVLGTNWDGTELKSSVITEYRRKIKDLIYSLSQRQR